MYGTEAHGSHASTEPVPATHSADQVVGENGIGSESRSEPSPYRSLATMRRWECDPPKLEPAATTITARAAIGPSCNGQRHRFESQWPPHGPRPTEPWARTSRLNVIVHDGTVDLWGGVRSQTEKQAVRVAAELTPGVRAVNDDLINA